MIGLEWRFRRFEWLKTLVRKINRLNTCVAKVSITALVIKIELLSFLNGIINPQVPKINALTALIFIATQNPNLKWLQTFILLSFYLSLHLVPIIALRQTRIHLIVTVALTLGHVISHKDLSDFSVLIFAVRQISIAVLFIDIRRNAFKNRSELRWSLVEIDAKFVWWASGQSYLWILHAWFWWFVAMQQHLVVMGCWDTPLNTKQVALEFWFVYKYWRLCILSY